MENYLDILQDLLLSHHLPVFTKRAQRTLVAHPKFYLFDAGVYRTLRKSGVLDISSEIDGITLEGLVLQHLRAWSDYSKEKYELSYWRTKAGLEVDFVIYGKDAFLAIEVKNNDKIFTKDLRGLLNFKEDYPESKLLILYRGKEKLVIDGVLCMPCDEFLKSITPNHSLV